MRRFRFRWWFLGSLGLFAIFGIAKVVTAAHAAPKSASAVNLPPPPVFVAEADRVPAAGEELVVGVDIFPPLVMQNQDGSFRGLDIDLWKAVAEEIGVKFRFQAVEFKDIFQALQDGRIDAAMAGITITEERERKVDFSHHYFDSGLRILVNKDDGSGALTLLKALADSDLGTWLLWYLLFLAICSHLAWWFERGSDGIHDKYIPGIFEAFWYSVVTSTTVGYGDIAPKRWMGRITSMFMQITGIAITGIFIGHVSSLMTIDHMESDISSVDDLRGKTVATVENTTSVDVLRQAGAKVWGVHRISEAYRLLDEKSVDAVVYDAPGLLYYVRTDGADKAMVTGPMFERQYYGIALPEQSPLRERINLALQKFRRNGVYEKIYERWLGELNR